jgi:hypothetical protein
LALLGEGLAVACVLGRVLLYGLVMSDRWVAFFFFRRLAWVDQAL